MAVGAQRPLSFQIMNRRAKRIRHWSLVIPAWGG